MRELHPDFEAELSKDALFPVQLVECDFLPEAVYFWSGLGTLHHGGKSYLGLDRGAVVESVTETGETQASSVNMTVFLKKTAEDLGFLTGIKVRGRVVTIIDALLESESQTVIAVDTVFRGVGGNLQLRVGPRAYELGVTVANELEALKKTWGLTHSEADQQRLYPGDTSHRFLPFFQDVNFKL